ncbi:sugar transporter ERD6-like 4 [Drosophila novamexicana]|uniref:sugar transporter ERD6-like 4 n=1 Tax=Drosophila novamexicana TaxID=47314 RepID=UPI0011E588A1|nr:sugar transporter ERD6-like 4 [Drosophila novamexicana]
MAIGQPTPDTHIEVIATSRPQSRFNCCVNRQRLHSIITGMVIFSYGGMDMAQGLGWNRYTGIADSYQFEFSWFIGVIIGAMLSALAVVHVPKLYFYALAIVMQLIDAIICVSAPYNYEAMVAARYIGGIGIGVITVPFIIHNSEVAPSDARGKWCAVEQSGLGLGIAIQVIMDSMWNPALSIGNNQVHGIIGIVFAIVAIAILMLSVESPIFQLRRNDYEMAITCQWELMDKNATSEDHNEALEENKRYVSEGSHESLGHDLSASMIPFIKMFFCRCLVAFSFSVPLTKTIIASTVVWQGTMYSWPIIVWRILRWIGTLLAILVMDKLGRKLLSMVALVCMAGLMLGMAGIYSNWPNTFSPYYMAQVCRISMVFQMFAGLFVACTPAYMGEAFPMRVKPFMIALIVCIEQVIHIIVIVTFDRNPNSFFQYYLSVGIILLISMLILLVMLPETRKMTLRQAGYRFRRLHDIWAH